MDRDKKLSILVINWQDITNPQGGGAEVHLHEIFKRVAAKGHKVTLLCCWYKGALKEQVIDNIHIKRCGNRSLFNFFVPFEYKKLRKTNRFDIAIDDLNKIPFYTPLFVKEPILALVHHFFGKSIYFETSWLPASYVYYSEKLVPLLYKKTPFAAVSNSTKEELLHIGIRPPVNILANGVNADRYCLLPDKKAQTPVIGYLGRLKKYKSVDHILQAFVNVLDKIPECRLAIVGDGDFRRELSVLAKELEIDKQIDFYGHVSLERKIELLNNMWLAVNPSPKEGWGLTVIEANACGVPVVAADSPGLRDSVVNDKTGLLYEYGNINQLTQQVLLLLQNKDKRQEFGNNALKWAQEFTWEKSANKAIEIIDQIINKKFGERTDAE